MTASAALDRALDRVVGSGSCSGCGACTLLDPGLAMRLADDGWSRPHRVEAGRTPDDAAATFEQVCPGRRLRAARPPRSHRHPLLGPVVSCWEAWAADEVVRHRGSSGGTLTALSTWLLEQGEVEAVSTVRVDAAAPRRTVPVTITTRAEALASAGSRYAPVSTLRPGVLEPGTALVAKPCEASAARALLERRGAADPDGADPGTAPLLLSFFCAGTPSQPATDALVAELGLAEDVALSDLWYRGRGWPGAFTAVAADGTQVSTSYDESWGQHLGRATQWRCKICPDGVGESADVSAADFWRTDERGYPVFTEGAGTSALIARTVRGHDLLERAFAAGVLVGRPLDPDAVAGVQPLQTSRRETLFGRLAGTLAAGRRIPRYTGFGLARLAVPHARQTVRTARASFGRVRRAGRADRAGRGAAAPPGAS